MYSKEEFERKTSTLEKLRTLPESFHETIVFLQGSKIRARFIPLHLGAM